MRHFLTISDLTREEAMTLVERGRSMKAGGGVRSKPLEGKVIILIFEKASTRTRLSFQVGIARLGGEAIFMSGADSQLGRSEPLRDTARVISRYADGMVVRTFGQDKLDELVKYGSVPVINALTDETHPCQVMSDMLTIYERTPIFEDVTVAWVGDGNNMAHSFINAASRFPFLLRIACPEGYDPKPGIIEKAQAEGARIEFTRDPAQAVAGADYVNTDVFASMGQEEEAEKRLKTFAPFQVNAELLALAKPGAKVMHCLPAHRGEEVTDEIIEGPASIVFDQAENRLWAQMAILEWIYTA